MLQAAPEEETGNTKSVSKNEAKAWFFTWNNYPVDARDALLQLCQERCTSWAFQSEVGKEGTPHIQGMFVLKKKARWSAFKLPKEIHWEVSRDPAIAAGYCTKDETHDGSIREVFPRPKVVLKNPIKGELKQWQKDLESLYHTEPDDRTIHWYWESKGGVGKSSFMKYMKIRYPDHVIGITCTKSADIVTIAHEDWTYYIFDFPRSNEGFFPWNALEQIKNGYVCDGKLKKKVDITIMNPPHVVCFANCPPDLEKMSSDRWNVREID